LVAFPVSQFGFFVETVNNTLKKLLKCFRLDPFPALGESLLGILDLTILLCVKKRIQPCLQTAFQVLNRYVNIVGKAHFTPP